MEARVVRQAGYAIYGRGAYMFEIPSCQRCAKTLSAPWKEGLFEGMCQGCEVRLTGNPDID